MPMKIRKSWAEGESGERENPSPPHGLHGAISSLNDLHGHIYFEL